jgi:hypothetical protein
MTKSNKSDCIELANTAGSFVQAIFAACGQSDKSLPANLERNIHQLITLVRPPYCHRNGRLGLLWLRTFTQISSSVEKLSQKSLASRFINRDDDKGTITTAKEELRTAIDKFQVRYPHIDNTSPIYCCVRSSSRTSQYKKK